MTKIKKLGKKILGKKLTKTGKKILRRPESYTKEFWVKAANLNTKKTIEKICTDYDENLFQSNANPFFYKENIFNSDSKVLDLACGMGRTCKWIAPKVRKYVGVDFIPEMIEKAKEYNRDVSNTEFYVNDGQTLKIFEDKSFDLVYCELAFQHMIKSIQHSYVLEIFRVLKNNGLFFGQIPKMSYYHDESFALTKPEIEELFKDFKIISLKDSLAYYVIEAKKL